jgi:hypothetical protein
MHFQLTRWRRVEENHDADSDSAFSMWPVLNLPSLRNGTPQANIAGILPLTSLIEFIDIEAKLHCYQLSGRGIAWNWPSTPRRSTPPTQVLQEGKTRRRVSARWWRADSPSILH